jgi:hypothetical protein
MGLSGRGIDERPPAPLDGRVSESASAEIDVTAIAVKAPFPKRVWKWFSAQGLVAKLLVSVLTAVITAVAVGATSRLFFGGGDATTVPTTTTLAPDAAPFTVATQVSYSDAWSVWLEKPLPDPALWPKPDASGDVSDEELHRFADGLGAVDDGTWLRIVLDGTAGRTSTITGAHAVVLERRNPSPTALFGTIAQGSQQTIGWYFDLDERSSPARELTDVDAPNAGPLYFPNRTVTVAPGEAVSVDAFVSTRTCDCSWVLELDVVVDGKPRVVRVDNDGQPFRTAGGGPDVPEYRFVYFADPPDIYRITPDGSFVPPAS